MSKPIKVILHDGEMGEGVWAQPVSNTTAKVLNIPCFTSLDVKLGDLVEHDGGAPNKWPHYVRTIERVPTRTIRRRHNCRESEFQALGEYLAEHDIRIEGITEGVVALSVPDELGDDALESVEAAAPAKLAPYE